MSGSIPAISLMLNPEKTSSQKIISGLQRHAPCQLKPLLVPCRQGRGDLVRHTRVALKPDLFQDIYCNRVPVPVLAASAPSARFPGTRRPQGNDEVLEGRQGMIRPHYLECPGNPDIRYFMRLPAGYIFALEDHPARIRLDKTR